MSVKPTGKIIKTTAPLSTEERIRQLRKLLGLDHKWEDLKLKLKLEQNKK